MLPQFTGVTVGLGIFSSLLDSSAEDVWVTGTISTDPDGSELLEVVFTLKPVCWFPRRVMRLSRTNVGFCIQMMKKPQPTASQKKRPKKQTPATYPSQATQYPSSSSQPPARTSSLSAFEAKARNAKYYKPDGSLPPPILSGQTKSHYPVRSTSFPSQPPPQTKPTISYDFSSSTPQTTQLQSLLSVLSSAQNRNSVLSVLSLMDGSKSSAATTSSVGSTPSSKGSKDAFATALKSLLSAASAASTSTNSVPTTHPPVALLGPPPGKLNDLPSLHRVEKMTQSPPSFLLVQLQRTHHLLHAFRQRYDASRKTRQLWTRRTSTRLNILPLRSRRRGAMARRFYHQRPLPPALSVVPTP